MIRVLDLPTPVIPWPEKFVAITGGFFRRETVAHDVFGDNTRNDEI
jgi:hypothetical protein